jgi:hypothetical protein
MLRYERTMNSMPPDAADATYDDDPYDDGLYEDEEEPLAPRHYLAVNRLAVLSLVFGALSFLTVFSWFFGALPAAAVVMAMLAVRQIDRSPQEMQGKRFAWVGLALALVLWTAGGTCLAIRQQRSVPPGYKVITFADLQPDKKTPTKVPATAVELHEERIFIKGYMYPGRQVFRVKQFVMVPSANHCKFCLSSIVPTQMIRVEMVGDNTADYKTTISDVGGKLIVDKKVTLGRSPYLIEADFFR